MGLLYGKPRPRRLFSEWTAELVFAAVIKWLCLAKKKIFGRYTIGEYLEANERCRHPLLSCGPNRVSLSRTLYSNNGRWRARKTARACRSPRRCRASGRACLPSRRSRREMPSSSPWSHHRGLPHFVLNDHRRAAKQSTTLDTVATRRCRAISAACCAWSASMALM
jgi:hypothetical protein